MGINNRLGNGWGQGFVVATTSWFEARLYVAAAYVSSVAIFDRFQPPPTLAPINAGLLAWDGAWYREIATNGYGNLAGAERFFPLWPLIGRVLGTLGNRPDIALVVAANVLAIVAGVLLYQLTIQETKDPLVAKCVVRLFALFPCAFVLVFAYSEALFISLSLGFVLCVRARLWWAAILLGFLAGLTRPVASLLAILAIVGLRQKRDALGWLSVVSAPLGTSVYLLWAQLEFGNALAPFDAQAVLRGSFREPFTRIIDALVEGFNGDWGELLHALAALILLFLLVVAVRKLSTDLWLFAIPSTLLLFAADNLNSIERYALAVFPLVIAAGLLSHQSFWHRWLPTASAVGLTTLTTLSLTGLYVP